jgi:hypothetical protein
MKQLLSLAAATLLLSIDATRGALVDYYTLNDNTLTAGGGRTDVSGSSAGGGNLVNKNGPGNVSLVTGKISGALQFPNTLDFTTAAVNSLALPLTFSIWVNTTAILDEVDRAIALSDAAQTTRDFGLAITNPTRQAAQIARNGSVPNSSVAPGSINDGNWHLITGVFASATNRMLYLDGKLASSSTVSTSLWTNNSTTVINVGGVLRSSGVVETFNGALDDAGVFNTALTAADIALINGLGQTASVGLDQLDEAQALNASTVGTGMDIGGVTWFKTDNLSGETGDYGGSLSTGVAYIITDGAAGLGITNVPEPHSLILLACGALAAASRRRPKPRLNAVC